MKSSPCRYRARIAAIWLNSTPGSDTAADVRCRVDGAGSSAAIWRTQRSGSKPMGRTTTSSSATGSSSSSASPTTVASSDSMPAIVTSSSRFDNHALLPWPPKATAYGSPALSRSTRACTLVRSASSLRRLSCSWIVTGVYLPRTVSSRWLVVPQLASLRNSRSAPSTALRFPQQLDPFPGEDWLLISSTDG